MIEKDEAILQLIDTILTEENYEVIRSTTEPDALQKIIELKPDGVFWT